MARVFITSAIFDEDLARLRDAGHEVRYRDALTPIPREALLEGVADAEALICLLSDRIDDEVLTHAPHLRIVANVAVGYENVDVAAATQRNVTVTNTPGVLTETTADLTLGLLLAVARRIVEGDVELRAGRFGSWGLKQPLMGSDVYDRTLGVVGMGRIGAAVARRARLGFGMKILYHNRHRDPETEQALGAEWVPLDRLLEESDFVSVHVPLTPQTRHMFGADEFARMKPSATFINVARGPVVDEDALVNALRTGAIAGAGLDVFEREPDVHPGLIELRERVVLLPHIGSASDATRRAMARIAVDNTLAVLAGDAPLSPVA